MGFTPAIQAKVSVVGAPKAASLILTPRAPPPRSQVVLTSSAPLRLRVRSRIPSSRRGPIPPDHSNSARVAFHESLTQRRSDAEGLILIRAVIDTSPPSSLEAMGESKGISPRSQVHLGTRGNAYCARLLIRNDLGIYSQSRAERRPSFAKPQSRARQRSPCPREVL